MDPISALIGGGASLLGGLMNTSSHQSINTANLQNSMWSAEGGYLPGLVANAKAAGINPLAVLGQHAPDLAVQTPTDPGGGLENFGSKIAQVDPYTKQKMDLDIAKSKSDLEASRISNMNTMVQTSVNQYMLEYLKNHPSFSPSGANPPPADQSFVGSTSDWFANKFKQMWHDLAPLPYSVGVPGAAAPGIREGGTADPWR